MNVLDATRAWMRAQCPLINRQDLFNANYLGAEPTEYPLCTSKFRARMLFIWTSIIRMLTAADITPA